MAVVAFVGMDALKERLKQLHQDLAGKTLREAVWAGARVLKTAIENAAPGEVSRHIVIHERQVRKYSQMSDELALLVGPEKKKAFYALWIESGFSFTSGRKVKRRTVAGAPLLRVLLPGGRWVTIRQETFGKRVARHPFVRPAFDSSQGEALAAAERTIAAAIQAESR